MFDTILLDFDGTVFNTAEGITKSVQYALKKLGIEAGLNELLCFCGPPLVDMFMEKFGLSLDEAKLAVTYYRERYNVQGLAECRVYEGIRELVLQLRSHGRKVAVATSKPTVFANKIMADNGMDGVFDLVMGCEFDGTRSAKWEVIAAAMNELGAKKETTVMVGDRKYDVEGAHTCGIPCVGVGYGYAEPGEFEAAGAEYTVETVAELADFLQTH